jgi:hypothetical protein
MKVSREMIIVPGHSYDFPPDESERPHENAIKDDYPDEVFLFDFEFSLALLFFDRIGGHHASAPCALAYWIAILIPSARFGKFFLVTNSSIIARSSRYTDVEVYFSLFTLLSCWILQQYLLYSENR